MSCAGELIVDAGYEISDTIAEELIASGVKTVEIVTELCLTD